MNKINKLRTYKIHRNFMAILLLCFFYLEHERVMHAKEVPPTKPGKHSCISCNHYFWNCCLKKLKNTIACGKCQKSWLPDLFCCREQALMSHTQAKVAQHIFAVPAGIFWGCSCQRSNFCTCNPTNIKEGVPGKNLNHFLKVLALNGCILLSICWYLPFLGGSFPA